MNHSGHKRVIISGGGTGGHVFPAISIANAIRKIVPATEILFAGAEGKLEMEKVPEAGYKIIGLPISGISRKRILKNFTVALKLLKSLKLAKKIIMDFNPDVAVGVGGYASWPVMRQAGKMGIPTIIQEQNSFAGITNRILGGKASVICVAYEGMEKYFPAEKIIRTGNPVRNQFEKLAVLKDQAFEYFGLNKELPVVLILGGSLGAGTINKCFSENIRILLESDCQWLWQTGKSYLDEIEQKVAPLAASNILLYGFIDRMDYAYSVADVVVSRAGAGTISELSLAAKPSILVPSPNVAEDHQTRNAMALVQRDAALIVPDKTAADELVKTTLKLVSDKSMQVALSHNIAAMADRDADKRIAEEILKLAAR